MTLIQKVTRRTVRYVRHVKRQRVIARLESRTDWGAQRLAQVLKSTVEGQVSPEERAWIKKIEALRATACASTETIEVLDFGASKDDASDSPDQTEADEGRIITKTVGEICSTVGKRNQWALLLFKLVRTFKPSICLELGTNFGFSAAYQAAALRLNQGGRFVTLEGAPTIADYARHHLHELGLDDVEVVTGRFQDTLGDVLAQNKPLDYVFIDGHHDEQATLAYFRQISPFLAPKAVLVFDDIHWSRGMERAWAALVAAPEVNIALDLHIVGICIIDKSLKDKASFNLSLFHTKSLSG